MIADQAAHGSTEITSRPSLSSCTQREFSQALVALCLLKRSTAFSADQIKAWYAVLGRFKATTVNRAVILVASNLSRFPELADILQECRKIEPPEVPYNPHGSGREIDRLTRSEVVDIAERLGLDV